MSQRAEKNNFFLTEKQLAEILLGMAEKEKNTPGRENSGTKAEPKL